MYDVIIVGGGPAGLSAALVLGRCRRRVLVLDAGHPRNEASLAMHGFITRDGTNPKEFLRIAREQLGVYPSVEVRDVAAHDVARGEERFTITTTEGESFSSRILLLATGLSDHIPEITNIRQFWGTSVHLCPYCDGWEHRDQTIAVYGEGQAGADLALEMLGWTHDVVLCTNGGPADFAEKCGEKLKRYQVRVIETPIARLEGEGDQLRGVRFTDGEFLPCGALFFSSPQEQRCDFAERLGCKTCEENVLLEHDECELKDVPGLYVAGNTARGLQLVIMAAASGTLAAFKINEALLDADAARAIGEDPNCE